jgi:hypothetical protein
MTGVCGIYGDIDFDKVSTGDALTVLQDAISHNEKLSADQNIISILNLISIRFLNMNEIIRKQSIEIAQLKSNNQRKDGVGDVETKKETSDGF